MAFERRVCVLRQVRKGFSADGSALTGAVYAERLGSDLTVTPRIAALSPLRDGRYALFVWADGKTYCLELKGNTPIHIENAPSIAAGFAALLCFVKGDPEPVAFGRCGAAPEKYAPLLEDAPSKKRVIPIPVPPVQTPAPAPNVPLAPSVPVPDPRTARASKRIVLEGDVPSPLHMPSGCPFRTRCRYATEQCAKAMPPFTDRGNGHYVACWNK